MNDVVPGTNLASAGPASPTGILATVTLDDKYVLQEGQAFLTGMQALTRLPLMQRLRDERAGLNTAGYISGYRGSPLGTYDFALWQARPHLEAHHIHFDPGVNEDLAATAVWGSQQVNMLGQARYDGVFGIWYGKAPGVDRTLDVFRHANVAGTSPHGGVLALAGDDPNAVSSTVTGYSEYNFVSTGIPLIYPATLQEYLDFGLLGIAMSRYAGCWTGFKAVTDIAESSAIVDLALDRVVVRQPEFAMPVDGVHIRWPDDRLAAEKRLMTVKLDAVRAFARVNPFDRTVWDTPDARFGLIAAGKAWLDLCQALADLGIDAAVAARHGIRLRKVGLVWPMEEQGIDAFCAGLERVLVVEEKRGFMEEQIMARAYRGASRPEVLGKTDASGAELLPNYGELSPARIAAALLRALPALNELPAVAARRAIVDAQERARCTLPAVAQRTAYFCSGCPHNSSTKVPEGSLALAGIGCHWLSLFMDRGTATFTQMGGEGATWLGMAPFTDRKHVFVNLGDGTYHHSGVLAIRAAVYAKANVTYKLLFNDAVAMTGGQLVADTYTPQQIVAQVLAEGVQRAVVVSDDIDKYRALPGPNGGFPAGVDLFHRSALETVQRTLRDTAGVTVLVYDQTCAAEKRRRRKRGKMVDPDTRVYIHPDVCEGCGDCSVQSNCIAIEPLETALGRKRRINQSACNKDLSCVGGFCPSFVTLRGATPRKAKAAAGADIAVLVAQLPLPVVPDLARPWEIVITGIGGTGVITIGAVLGMAARLAGRGVTCLDQTGIAQKNGAVLSHVRIAARQQALFSMRVANANADLVLGCDLMVAASPAAVGTMRHGHTRVIANTHLAPNAQFVLDPVHAEFGVEQLRATLEQSVGGAAIAEIAATHWASRLFGDAIFANMFLLGYAFQRGLVPLPLAALERAIAVNGAAVSANQAALAWGRLFAADAVAAARQAAPAQPIQMPVTRRHESFDELVADRRQRLVAYQDEAYARRYEELVERARRAESALGMTGTARFAPAVARQAFKLMACKDEYEVARLYSDPAFLQRLGEEFEGDFAIGVELAPPLFARRDPATGHLKKRRYGAWIFRAMAVLAHAKGLRGSLFDPFGKTAERRMERQLSADYVALVETLCTGLTAERFELAVELANLPAMVRGFGHVKEVAMARYQTERASLLQAWQGGAQRRAA